VQSKGVLGASERERILSRVGGAKIKVLEVGVARDGG
jgi:hypothetical protein